MKITTISVLVLASVGLQPDNCDAIADNSVEVHVPGSLPFTGGLEREDFPAEWMLLQHPQWTVGDFLHYQVFVRLQNERPYYVSPVLTTTESNRIIGPDHTPSLIQLNVGGVEYQSTGPFKEYQPARVPMPQRNHLYITIPYSKNVLYVQIVKGIYEYDMTKDERGHIVTSEKFVPIAKRIQATERSQKKNPLVKKARTSS